jgi:HAMP domain-containing protein
VAVQFANANRAWEDASTEAAGATYVANGPMKLLHELERHRLLDAAVRSGDATQADLDASTATIENDLLELKALGATHRDWDLEPLVAHLQTKWDELKATDPASPEKVIVAHNAMVEEAILPLIFRAGNASRLYRDPEVNTLDTSIGVNADLARTSEAGNRAAAWALVARLNLGPAPTDAARTEAITELQALRTARESGRRWVGEAMAADPAFRAALQSPLQQSDAEAILVRIRVQNALDPNGRPGNRDFVSAAHQFIVTNRALFTAGNTVVKKELDDRMTAIRTTQVLVLAISGGAFALALMFASAVAASITRPIKRLAKIADQMSLGQLDVKIDVEADNEVGQLAESLRRMQASLKGAIERLRARKAAA